MVNKHKQIICDETGLILNDGVTLFPGYIEVKEGKLIRYDSQDPHNQIYENAKHPDFKPGMLHHRVEYRFVAEEESNSDKRLDGKHFMSRIAMQKYLENLK